MSYRVTNFTKMNNILLTLTQRMRNMSDYQEQMVTNRRVIHPSDDPAGTYRILTLNGEIALNEQHQRNLDNTQGVLNFSESIIVAIEEVITQAREDAILADSDTVNADEREIISHRINLLLEDLHDYGNTRYADRYIFSGTNLSNQTFIASRNNAGEIVEVALNPLGTDGEVVREIGNDHQIVVNVDGEQLLMADQDSDLYNTLIRFRDALRNNDLDEIGATIDRLDAAHDQVLTQRTYLGAMGQRVMQAEELAMELAIDYTEDLSRVEDVDYAEAMMQYTIEENAYQAALSAASRVLQPTLLDFLG